MNRLLLILLIPYFLFCETLFTKEELDYIKNKKVILVSSEYDYEPYDFVKNHTPMGYSIDLLNLLLKDTGLEVKYVTKPWEQLLKELDNKNIDLLHTIYKTPQREKIYRYSQGYSKVTQTYIQRVNDNDIKNVKELFSKKVGICKGWAEEKFFNKYPKIYKIYYKNLEEKLNALSTGKIDAIANSSSVANYMIRKYGYTNLKISTPRQ